MDSFIQYINFSNLSKTTKQSHLRYIKLMKDLLETYPEIVQAHLAENYTLNKQFQVCKTLSKYYEFHKRDEDRVKILNYALDIKSRLSA